MTRLQRELEAAAAVDLERRVAALEREVAIVMRAVAVGGFVETLATVRAEFERDERAAKMPTAGGTLRVEFGLTGEEPAEFAIPAGEGVAVVVRRWKRGGPPGSEPVLEEHAFESVADALELVDLQLDPSIVLVGPPERELPLALVTGLTFVPDFEEAAS